MMRPVRRTSLVTNPHLGTDQVALDKTVPRCIDSTSIYIRLLSPESEALSGLSLRSLVSARWLLDAFFSYIHTFLPPN